MITLRRIHLGLGMVLMAGLAALGGCAATTADEPSTDEAAQAIDPIPELPPGGIAICTMSGPTFTGRQWAALMPARRPGVAYRVRLGGEAPGYYRSCYDIAREIGLEIIE